MKSAILSLALAVACSALACKSTKREQVPQSELAIGDARVVTGPVGIGVKERDASYVLVDVANRGTGGSVVTMGGELLDLAEESLGALRTETLRIPAGESRMFALVDRKVEALVATAQTARVTLQRATRPEKKPTVVVTNFTQSEDQGRVVIEGFIENRGASHVKVIVLGGFYDAAGLPMMRRTTLYKLDGGGRRSAQFVGPVGSDRGSLYIGDVGL